MNVKVPIAPIRTWSFANQGFYANFQTWLKESGYRSSACKIYGIAARYALGHLQKEYWKIDPEKDLKQAWLSLQASPLSISSVAGYRKGLLKLAEYLRIRLRKPPPERQLNWTRYLNGLPAWLDRPLHDYITHRARKWREERRYELAMETLSSLTSLLRWVNVSQSLDRFEDFTPERWYAFMDHRLAQGISPVTLNRELAQVQDLARFLESQGEAICERLLRVPFLNKHRKLPRDASLEQLCILFREIQQAAQEPRGLWRREAVMDCAWFLLMLHSGLRTGEVRRLKLADLCGSLPGAHHPPPTASFVCHTLAECWRAGGQCQDHPGAQVH